MLIKAYAVYLIVNIYVCDLVMFYVTINDFILHIKTLKMNSSFVAILTNIYNCIAVNRV